MLVVIAVECCGRRRLSVTSCVVSPGAEWEVIVAELDANKLLLQAEEQHEAIHEGAR